MFGVAMRSLGIGVWAYGTTFAWVFIITGFLLGILALSYSKGRIMFFTIALVMVGLGAGVLRMDWDVLRDQSTRLEDIPVEDVTMIGVVAKAPDERERTTKLTVDVYEIIVDSQHYDVVTKVLLTTDRYPRYHYGDHLEIVGTLRSPENFITDTGREFDYISYLWKDDITYQVSYPESVTLLETGQGNLVVAKMINLKDYLLGTMYRLMHRPESALLAGELFGEKAALGGTLQEDFRRTGLIHVVVLSGYNVTLVAKFLITILGVFSVTFGYVLAIIGIILFAILTGGGATVIRASIMALLVILSRMTGREYLLPRGLVIAAVVMVLHNPRVLLFDIGFQLSFLATVGLVYLAPRLEPYLRFVPKRWSLRDNLVATIATQLFVLPLLILTMGQVSLIAIVTNMLALVAVPIAMLFGFLMALVAPILPAIGFLLSVPAYLALKYQIVIVENFSRLPRAVATLPPVAPWLVAVGYVIWVIWLLATHDPEQHSYESTWELSSPTKR